MPNSWNEAQKHEKEYFDSGKNKQWKTPHSLEYWMNFLHLKTLEGKGIEIGCGPNGLYNFTDKVIGVDSIDYGKENFILGKAEDLPFNERFDFAICCNALDHFQNIDVAMKEMLRVTDRIILWTNVFPYLISRFLNIVDKTHPYHLTFGDVIKLITKHNLFMEFFWMRGIYSIHGKHASRKAKVKLFLASLLGMKGFCVHLEARSH